MTRTFLCQTCFKIGTSTPCLCGGLVLKECTETYKCQRLGCGHVYNFPAMGTSCLKCGHIYVEWTSFDEWEKTRK